MNFNKNLKRIVYSSACLLFIVLYSCDSDDAFSIENPKTLDFQSFSLEVPQDWTGFTQQGIDTYIGGLTNQVDTLYFDYGYLSFGSIDDVNKTSETISFETMRINGYEAKIVKEKRAEESRIRYSVYIDKRDKQNLNRIYGYGLENESLVKAIFRSHRFK